MFRKVLIANRGEIAVRISRTLRELGIVPVAVYAEADRAALHVRTASEAHALTGARPYLDAEQILDVARRTGCDALHPGYGYLSENASFAEACKASNITFIGPPASAISAMGSKQQARKRMQAAGVPVVPGGGADSLEQARVTAQNVGYPVLVKATDGGGGKGMRLVQNESELESALERTRSEAKKAFGSDSVYIEKAIHNPRHVEIQVLGDQQGNVVHLFERDCSIQRRHQKIIEETPCPVLSESLLAEMGSVAVRGAEAIGYFSAGTFEFLLAPDGSFYFLEMNTRLQVEHPITELITGCDLVREMIRVAEGHTLNPAPPTRNGAAIEARIYAEDPDSGFLPSPGRIEKLAWPGGPGVRVDTGIYEASRVSSDFDPMLAKLCVWAQTREAAILRMRRALGECLVGGVRTNLRFLTRVFENEAFARGDYDTGFIERHRDALFEKRTLSDDERFVLAGAAAILSFGSERRERKALTSGGLSPWVLAERKALGSR